MGIETAIIAGSLIAAGAAVGSSAYAASEEKKQQKKLIDYQEGQVRAAEEKAAAAEKLAIQTAEEKIKRKRRAQAQTIFTSPLGITGTDQPGLKSILGG